MDEEEEKEPKALDQLREMIGELTDDVQFLFMVQTHADNDKEATYQAFTTGEHALVMNSAVVALTIAGKDLMVAQGEDPEADGAESRAFFYGLQALSRTAGQWAEAIKARAQGEQGEEGPKHVKETVEDSAGGGDGSAPRTAHDGSSVH